MEHRGRFRLLVALFFHRFFENDMVSPGGGFQTNVYQVTAFLTATGWFISYFLMPPFLQLSSAPPTAETDWAVRTLRLFFTAYSFAIVGFASIFHWDMLFPDRRDFLALASLPVTLAELLVARLVALALLLLIFVAAINTFPTLMMIALSLIGPNWRGSGARLVLAQLLATGAASLFALVSVAACQGVLINLLPPRLFGRLSPWIQLVGMSGMVLCVLLYPLYALLLKPALEGRKDWPWFFPPVWFAGVYDLILPVRSTGLLLLGVHGLTLLAAAALIAGVAWGWGYRHHYVRTLEAEGASALRPAWRWPKQLVRLPEECAIADFSAKTLGRSRKHRLFLATYLSAGLSFAVLFALAVRAGKLVVTENGVRAFPFLIAFFVITGFRAVCQFPAELPANWVFRLTAAEWSEAARRAIRKQAIVLGLMPTLLLLLPLQLLLWEVPVVLLHSAFQFVAGALLVEAVFWQFDKVPFTCSYHPGRMNLALLAGMYLYGFTSYSFHLAQLERLIEGHAVYRILVFALGGALLTVSWRYRRPESAVRFEADEPLIQGLDLT